jgi:hypothetical protein
MKKVSIIGRGPGFERAILDQENGYDIWAPSTACGSTTSAEGIFPGLFAIGVEPNKIFQLHQRKVFEPWLKEKSASVVLIQSDVFYPACQVLPAQELVDKHGFRFGSSLAWMIAYAVELGYEEINIHGAHMAHETEYGIQRDTLFYFVGYAEGRGVKVNIDRDSGIFIGNQIYGVAT